MKKVILLISSLLLSMQVLSDNLELITQNQNYQYNVAQLLEVQNKELTTLTPWTKGEPTFKGLDLITLLQKHNIKSGQLTFTALNDYTITITVKDLIDAQAFLSMYQDNKILRVREKGPFWLIFPWSYRSELINTTVSSWAIWQIKSIEHMEI
ncbi:MAG: hypothetical protein HRU38_13085 [Saccharospirillaceae bacterium]|nr:hypothetical protein [Pseudomonadales bacterium]NRB79578.1 hypothetical protein [Saccharospirillaceae bacterium]